MLGLVGVRAAIGQGEKLCVAAALCNLTGNDSHPHRAATQVFFSVALCMAVTFAGMGAVRAVNTLTVR